MNSFIFICLLIVLGILGIVFTRPADSRGVLAGLIIYGLIFVISTIGIYELGCYLLDHVVLGWH